MLGGTLKTMTNFFSTERFPSRIFKIIPLYIIYRHHIVFAEQDSHTIEQIEEEGRNSICLRRHHYVSSAIVHHAD